MYDRYYMWEMVKGQGFFLPFIILVFVSTYWLFKVRFFTVAFQYVPLMYFDPIYPSSVLLSYPPPYTHHLSFHTLSRSFLLNKLYTQGQVLSWTLWDSILHLTYDPPISCVQNFIFLWNWTELCIYHIFFIHLWMDIYVDSITWILGIV